jgi:thymidylate synthase (FAD)
MEFLLAGFEIIEQKPGLQGIYEAAELPGRICYGSQDKIAEGTAQPFAERLMKSDHGAPLEHGTVYLKAPHVYEYYSNIDIEDNGSSLDKYRHNPYSKYLDNGDYVYVTTNLRVLFDNGWLDDLKYLCDEPTEYHEKRVMVRFVIDRFTGEEFLRHRKASFNRESTRYVNFSKERFGGGSIKYIVPTWLKDKIDDLNNHAKWNSMSELCQGVIDYIDGMCDLDEIFVWMFALKSAEWSYNMLTQKFSWQAQQARTVLPCAISSPLIKTAFVSDWKHFFNLRAIGTTGAPHPQAKELAEPLMAEFIDKGLIEM